MRPSRTARTGPRQWPGPSLVPSEPASARQLTGYEAMRLTPKPSETAMRMMLCCWRLACANACEAREAASVE